MNNTLVLLFMATLSLVCSCHSEQTENAASISENIEIKQDSILQKARFGKELIEAFVPFVSPAIISNHETHLSYELNLANTYRLPMKLTKVEVYDIAKKDAPIAIYDSTYIDENLERPGLVAAEKSLFSGSQFGILNLWLSVANDKTPTQIYHQLSFEVQTENGKSPVISLEKALIDFPKTTNLSLRAPFRKGNWFYYTFGHSNTRELTEGKSTYAQRYAIDWVAIGNDGTFMNGERRDENESFYSYGKELLAVADGVVVAIQDSIPDNAGESDERAIKLNRYNLSGNHLVLDIGNNINVVYAHLIPNSFKVKIGDRVKAGDVLGLLGNSGESTGPHLHIHVETKHKLVLGGEGLPFHFNEYTQVSTFDKSVHIDSLFLTPNLPMQSLNQVIQNAVPIGMGIVRF
ncbi:MAG: M23 family metallopeptidase [Saprospiraceae bacterium]